MGRLDVAEDYSYSTCVPSLRCSLSEKREYSPYGCQCSRALPTADQEALESIVIKMVNLPWSARLGQDNFCLGSAAHCDWGPMG